MDPRTSESTDKQALEFIADVLSKESLRFIDKCLKESEWSLDLYSAIGGVKKRLGVRLADLLALTYLKFRHEEIVRFFNQNPDCVIKEGVDENIINTWNMRNFIKNDLKDKEFKLTSFIENKLDGSIDELVNKTKVTIDTPELIEKIISLSFRCWYEEIYSDAKHTKYIKPENSFEVRDDVFSNPRVLRNFLSMTTSPTDNPIMRAIDIYNQHKEDKKVLNEISLLELVDYSRILREIEKHIPQMNLDVADAIMNRIFLDRSTLVPGSSDRDSIRNTAIYQFSFQLLEVFRRSRKTDKPTNGQLKAIELWKDFLTSSGIDFDSKFCVINSYANDEQAGASEVHRQLGEAFDCMMKFDNDVVIILQKVFDDFDRKYFIDEKIIYDNEENHFFVLFQRWSGQKNYMEEVQKIRAAALRGLEDRPEIVKSYWDQYGFETEWMDMNYSQVIEDMRFNVDKFQGCNVYMPLRSLIEISKKIGLDKEKDLMSKIEFWSAQSHDDRGKEMFIIKNDHRTLRHILIKRNFIKDSRIMLYEMISKEALEMYTLTQYPDKDIFIDLQNKFLNIVNRKKYKTVIEIDSVVEKVKRIIDEFSLKRPDMFETGTDFIINSLGLYDDEFFHKFPFSDEERELLRKCREDNSVSLNE